MESTNLWNVWVQLSNHFDREFTVVATDSEIDELRAFLANREHVMSYDIGREYGDTTVNDFKEELGGWISDEIE